MDLHLRRYTCLACGRSTHFWMPEPPPTEVTLIGGGCETCTTPRNRFALWVHK